MFHFNLNRTLAAPIFSAGLRVSLDLVTQTHVTRNHVTQMHVNRDCVTRKTVRVGFVSVYHDAPD